MSTVGQFQPFWVASQIADNHPMVHHQDYRYGSIPRCFLRLQSQFGVVIRARVLGATGFPFTRG
jgi:hypothetical protein